ncbi:hypothetical protein DWX43_01890 [Clostridium sp. AF19-22AC]|nr:hypothetical protein DWX43_01890 [Clostridium sp. AF19-22AC]
MDNTTKTVWQEELPAAVQHEDAVLKTMMHFFADDKAFPFLRSTRQLPVPCLRDHLCIVFRIDSASCN